VTSSDGDPGGSRVSDGADGGVLASLGEGLPSAEAEHSRLMPLLFSIVEMQGAREREREKTLSGGRKKKSVR
jgi:hypothetical protein